MILPTLYKKTKTDAIQQYKVWTEDSTIYVEQGQVDGKKQIYTTQIAEGKNIGKANETTPKQQADFEAQSKWNKKAKSGYIENPSGELQVKLPQKVKPYIGNEHKIKYPAYSTPKLNGVNGTYWLKEGKLILTSRGGDEYPSIPHLEPYIHIAMRELDTDCLNGELYIHGEHLQDITSAVKKPKELSKRLTFAIFELPNKENTYKQRRNHLLSFLANNENLFEDVTLPIGILTGIEVNSKEDIENHYNNCMKLGLEGTVIYNADAPYEFNVRSSHVYKYKKVLDEEFPIIDCEADKNGHPIFHCITKEGNIFKVKPKGTDTERKEIIANFSTKYRGKWYKIEYETLSKDGIPLKPVGICLRECDNNGNPTE